MKGVRVSTTARMTRGQCRNKLALLGKITLLLLLIISFGFGLKVYSSSYISLHQVTWLFSESINYKVIFLSKFSNAQQETVVLLLLGSLFLCLATGLKHSRFLKLHSKLKEVGLDHFSPLIGKAIYKRVIQTIVNHRDQYGKY